MIMEFLIEIVLEGITYGLRQLFKKQPIPDKKSLE